MAAQTLRSKASRLTIRSYPPPCEMVKGKMSMVFDTWNTDRSILPASSIRGCKDQGEKAKTNLSLFSPDTGGLRSLATTRRIFASPSRLVHPIPHDLFLTYRPYRLSSYCHSTMSRPLRSGFPDARVERCRTRDDRQLWDEGGMRRDVVGVFEMSGGGSWEWEDPYHRGSGLCVSYDAASQANMSNSSRASKREIGLKRC
jgi:hypothetical protein